MKGFGTRYVIAALLFVCFSFVYAPHKAWAGISIAPAYVELDLDKGKPSGQFIITNTGDTPERFRIKASHFNFTPTGGLLVLKDDENSIAPWIKFNPKELTLPPKSKQKVRFIIVPRGKLKDQEYWASMELESLKSNIARTKDAAGRTFKLDVSTSIMVPIFIRNGKILYQCDPGNTRVVPGKTGQAIESEINNSGTGHLFVTGAYEIIDVNRKVVAKGPLGAGYVLPGAMRSFSRMLNNEISKGEYTIKTVYTAPQMKEPKITETAFTW